MSLIMQRALSPDQNTEKSLFPRIPYFFSLTEGETLHGILQSHHNLFLEISQRDRIEHIMRRLLTGDPDFAVSLMNATAYTHPIADLIVESLNIRFGLQDHKILQIKTCLQEALMNAIVHGNLAIRSDFQTLERMDQYYLLIEKRMHEPPYIHRHITVSAWDEDTHLKVCVIDEGSGLKAIPDAPNDNKPHGRGLYLIQSMADRVWLGEEQGALFMTFNY
jgi:anti-sigma regulatory factor (Ser/Thr protein kinase)